VKQNDERISVRKIAKLFKTTFFFSNGNENSPIYIGHSPNQTGFALIKSDTK